MLLASALGKSLDLRGFVDVLVTYRLFPDWSLWFLAFGITGIEWGLTTWILVGRQLPTGALLAMMLNGLYAMGLILTLLRGIDLQTVDATAYFFHNRCGGILHSKTLCWLAFAMHCMSVLRRVVRRLTRFPNGRKETGAAHLSIEVREIG